MVGVPLHLIAKMKNQKNKKLPKDMCPTEVKSKRIIRSPRKYTKQSVLKMLAVMENQQPTGSGPSSSSATTPENGANAKEFLSSGRTGRRNALPNILGEHAVVGSSDLPNRLQALTTSEKGDDIKDTSGPSSKS